MSDKPNKKTNLLLGYIFFTVIYILTLKYRFIEFLLNPFSLSFIENKLALILFFFLFFYIAIMNFQWQNNKYKSILIGLCLFIIAQISALGFFPKSFKKITTPKHSFTKGRVSYKVLYPMMKKIYLDTGWTAKKAIKKIFCIGVDLEKSLLSYYALSLEEEKEGIIPFLLSLQKY